MQLLGSFQQKITALPEKFKKGCHGIRRVLRFKVKVGIATYTFSHCMVSTSPGTGRNESETSLQCKMRTYELARARGR